MGVVTVMGTAEAISTRTRVSATLRKAVVDFKASEAQEKVKEDPS